MLKHYLMDGSEVDVDAYIAKLKEDENYGVVGIDEIGDYRVGTRLMGHDMRMPFAEGPPLIFETMTFKRGNVSHGFMGLYEAMSVNVYGGAGTGFYRVVGQWWYSTLEEAALGHQTALQRAKRGDLE